jgi:plasmid stability protein
VISEAQIAQIVVRNIKDEAMAGLKRRAESEGKSVEALARQVLEREGARDALAEALALGEQARAWREARGITDSWDVAAAIREDRDNDEPYR